jgi:hypothetical protein
MTKDSIQLLLSAAALILTPFLSALVVRYQLKRSHYWWVQQQSFLEEQRYTQRKNDLYESAARVLPSLDANLVNLQVLLFSRSECECLLTNILEPELVNHDFLSKEYSVTC